MGAVATQIPASAYVQDGLIAQWDGIENAGRGLPHDPNATTWKNLVEGTSYDWSLVSGKYEWESDAVNAKSSLSTTGWLATMTGIKSIGYTTFETLVQPEAGLAKTTGSFFRQATRKGNVFLMPGNVSGYLTGGQKGANLGFVLGDRFSTSLVYNNDGSAMSAVYKDGVAQTLTTPNYGWLVKDQVMSIGGISATDGDYVFKGRIYTIRLYNRALTADEVAYNANIDKIRFDGANPTALTWPEEFRWNAGAGKPECRVIVEAEGNGTFKVGDGGWTRAVTNWVECGTSATVSLSAVAAGGLDFMFWRIGEGNPAEIQYSNSLELTVAGATVVRAVFRDATAKMRWIYLPSAQSGGAGSAVISNAVTHTVLKVSGSVSGLTIDGIFKTGDNVLDGDRTLDLSTPVESLDYATQYAITRINGSCLKSPFAQGGQNLYLPETLTTFGGQMIDCWGGASSLRRVRFPKNLTAVKSYGGTGGYQFRSCTNLLEVLPTGILESGQITDYANGNNMFQNCSHFTNCINFSTVAKVPSAILMDCPSVAGRVDIGHVTSVGGQAFKNCGKLIFPDPLVMPNVTSIGSDAFSGTTLSNLDVTGAAITTLSLNGATQLRTVKPKLYPDTVTSTYMYNCKELLGDVTLPSGFTSLGEQAFVDCQKITSLDLSRTTIKKFERWTFQRCYCVTNFVFPRSFNLFQSSTPFANETDLTHVRFTGDVPTIDVGDAQFSACAKMAFYVPLWNTTWDALMAEQGAEMTAADVTTYRTNHPGEPVPVQKLNLDGRSGAKPVARWAVDPPTETTPGPLSYFETLMADGVSASASPAQAFDGTTYALGAGDLMCTCAAGAEIVIAIPAAATLTRGLKLKAYRIHQMSAGEHPNGRAPTAWTLYGKQTDEGEWVKIDEVTMTAESANKWTYFGTDSAEIPARDAAALTYQLSGSASDRYVAVKFVPTASYRTTSGANDATPIGFGEIELLGQMVGVNPVIGSFAVARPGWKSATFGVELISAGEKIAERRKAEWVRGTVELSKTSDFAEIAASSAATDLVEGGTVPVTVSGLEIGVTYYARLKAANDLEGADEKALDGTVTTLTAPFEVAGGMFPAPVKGEDGFTVSVDIAQLLVSGATVELYYAPDGVTYGTEPIQTKAVTAAGTVTFDPFPSDDTFAFVKVRIVAEDGGVTYANQFVRSVHEIWLGNAVSVTAISNTVKGIVLKCSLSGTNVTVSGITAYNDQTVFDLTLPVCDSVCKPLAITSVGSTFANNLRMTELYLPDTITSLSNQALDQWGLSDGARSQLVKLRLPDTITSVTYYNFRGMRQLKDCENLMPKALTTLGENPFSHWVSITNDIHFYEQFRTFSNKTPFPNGWANVKRVYFHGAPADPTAGVFAPMTTLTFFVPRYDKAWESYLAESCETRKLTADEQAAFRTAYPGERPANLMVKMPAGAATWRYLRYWYPDPKKRPGMMLLVK